MIKHQDKQEELTQEEIDTQKRIRLKVKESINKLLTVKKKWNETKNDIGMEKVKEVNEFTKKVIKFSTDSPTVFNFRKDILSRYLELIMIDIKQKVKQSLENKEDNTDQQDVIQNIQKEAFQNIQELLKEEMMLMTGLLGKDPKSYEIWFHRIWIFKKIHDLEMSVKKTNELSQKYLYKELELCDHFLKKDERNFHVWNYRFELIEILLKFNQNDKEKRKQVIENQIVFLQQKISDNFSNYSALHFLTIYLQKNAQINDKKYIDRSIIQKEFERNRQALFISPNEQALWLFQKWITDNLVNWKIIYIAQEQKQLTLFFNFPVIAYNNWQQILVIKDEDEKVMEYKILKQNNNKLIIELEGDAQTIEFQSQEALQVIRRNNGSSQFEEIQKVDSNINEIEKEEDKILQEDITILNVNKKMF